MTATPAPQWTPPREQRSWGAGRIVALVLGIVLLLPGLALLAGGGALLWADRSGNRSDGYLFSDRDTFSSQGFAISSERIDLSTGADWLPISSTFGSARIEVTGTGSSEIFVGVAPVAQATAYLDGVQRTVVSDLGLSAGPDRTVSGGAPSGSPGDQNFWTDQASGPGTQQLTWTPRQGDWMLVVMNADGSAGISAQARIGATFPALTGLAWGLLIAGIVAVVIAALLLVLAFRRGAERRPIASGYPPAGAAQAPPIPAPRGTADAPSATDRPPSPSGTQPPA
jgi:hypothetical protein